jgi:hypothetical protein
MKDWGRDAGDGAKNFAGHGRVTVAGKRWRAPALPLPSNTKSKG